MRQVDDVIICSVVNNVLILYNHITRIFFTFMTTSLYYFLGNSKAILEQITTAIETEIKKNYIRLCYLCPHLLPEVRIQSLGCTLIYFVVRWRIVNKKR